MDKQVSWNIEKACCFTGHRNKDLPFSGDRNSQGMKCLVSSLQMYIEKAVKDGYDTFISGMAEGTDLICAEIVHNLITRKGMNLRLICAVPYKKQGAKELLNPLDQYVYNMLIQESEVVYVSDTKARACYQKRNRFMVENSQRIIGVFKESKTRSGTYQTIKIAQQAGLEMNIIYLEKNPVFYLSDDM